MSSSRTIVGPAYLPVSELPRRCGQELLGEISRRMLRQYSGFEQRRARPDRQRIRDRDYRSAEPLSRRRRMARTRTARRLAWLTRGSISRDRAPIALRTKACSRRAP